MAEIQKLGLRSEPLCASVVDTLSESNFFARKRVTRALCDIRSAERDFPENSERPGPPDRTARIFPAFGARD